MDGAAGYLVIGVRYFVRVRSFTPTLSYDFNK